MRPSCAGGARSGPPARSRSWACQMAIAPGGDRDLLSALHTIQDYPFALNDPIFAQYPAMKLGHSESVDCFARLLAPMIRQWMVHTPPADRDWVLTSPPLQGLPCGANLVCRA